MTRLLGKVTVNGAEYRIVLDDQAKKYPYRLTQKKYNHLTGYKTRTVNTYGSLTECLYTVAGISNGTILYDSKQKPL